MSIGERAFYGSSLESVTFGENSQLTSIGYAAFRNCYNLASIVIPNSVTSIGSYAFHMCNSLTIYCKITEVEKPSGWGSNWNSDRPVVWGYTGN